MPVLKLQPLADGYSPYVWKHGNVSITVEHTIDVGWGTPMAYWEYDVGTHNCAGKLTWNTKEEALDDFYKCFPEFKGKFTFKS